jgi:hypothetical protein
LLRNQEEKTTLLVRFKLPNCLIFQIVFLICSFKFLHFSSSLSPTQQSLDLSYHILLLTLINLNPCPFLPYKAIHLVLLISFTPPLSLSLISLLTWVFLHHEDSSFILYFSKYPGEEAMIGLHLEFSIVSRLWFINCQLLHLCFFFLSGRGSCTQCLE